jgi:hypothetical protein
MLVSCIGTQKEPNETTIEVVQCQFLKDSLAELSVSSYSDTGLIVNTSTYNIEEFTIRKFGEIEIPIKVFATFEPDGYGKVDSLILSYKGNAYGIIVNNLCMSSPVEMMALDKPENYTIRLYDFNFDRKPDLAIYNCSSGVKNVLTDKYIYSPNKDMFVYNKELSSFSNCRIDSINKTLYTLASGGHASRIYGSGTYKWEDDELVMLKKVNQDYNHSLNVFVREIRELIDTKWILTVDTLTVENSGEWQ